MSANPEQQKWHSQHYIIMPRNQTVRDALVRLWEQNGQEWWFLVVDYEDGIRYYTARFSALRAQALAEGPAFFERRLDRIGPPLEQAVVVGISADIPAIEGIISEVGSPIVVVVRRSEALYRADSPPLPPVVGLFTVSELQPTPEPESPSLYDLAGIGLHEAMKEEAGAEEAPMVDAEEAGSTGSMPPMPRMSSEPPEPERRRFAGISPDAYTSSPLDRITRLYDPSHGARRAEPPTEHVEGDIVGDDKIIHGDEIHGNKIIYTGTQPEETREQMRRFEAAFPHECHQGQEQRLYVAVMLPDALSPFGAEAGQDLARTDEVPIALPIDALTGQLKPVEIEVSVTATGCRVEGESTKSLTVWPDGRISKRWFQIEPEVAGRQVIGIELSLHGRLLTEMELETMVYKPEEKPHWLLNLSLRTILFTVTLNFAPGMGA